MEQRTYPQVWKILTPEQKQTLSERADCSYDYLKLISHRKGRCGRHLARIITTELVAMGCLDGTVDDQVSALFPISQSPAHRSSHMDTPACQ